MRKASAILVSAPVLFATLAYAVNDRETYGMMFLAGWIIFTAIALLWAFLIWDGHRRQAIFCAAVAVLQLVAFSVFFWLMDTPKTRRTVEATGTAWTANFALHWTGSSRFSTVPIATALAAAPGQ